MLSAIQSRLPKSLRLLIRSTNRNSDQFTTDEATETRQWIAIRDREFELSRLGTVLDPVLEVVVLFEWVLWVGGLLELFAAITAGQWPSPFAWVLCGMALLLELAFAVYHETEQFDDPRPNRSL